MTVRRAQCSCAKLRVICDDEPVKVSICHCDECRRRTASAFGMAAFFDRNRLTIAGESKTFTRNSDNGHAVTFHFCPNCGSTVFWEPSRKPGMIAVGVGAFADRDFPAPGQSVWDSNRFDWLTLPGSLARRAQG